MKNARWKRCALASGVALAFLLPPGCGAKQHGVASRPRNVVLVLLDSVRAERVHGLYPFVPDGCGALFVVSTNFVTSARGLAFWALPEDPASGIGSGTHLIDDAAAPRAW